MTDAFLDEALVERLLDDMEWEMNRVGPPEGFPVFHDIPSGRYTSQEFFDLEEEHLWRNSWICAGRVEDLPDLGSYFLFDELGPPLIVVRGGDGVIRCFSNTCMHRGAPVVREATGTVRYLRCLYHAWTYSTTDGSLLAVTDERDFPGLCKEEKGLPEIACDTWGGWVWLNMNPNPQPLVEFLGAVAVEMKQFQPESLRLVGTDHRVVDCNWKVAIEAFQEVYHFRFIHDRGGLSLLDSRGATMGLLANGNSRMVTPQSKHVVEATGRTSWRDLRVADDPFGFEPISTVHPIIHSTSYAFTIFPNVITPVGATGLPWLLFFPDGPNRTNLRIYHYSSEQNADKHESWQRRIAGFGAVIDEDVENLNPMGRAMNSPLYHGVPISYQERRIWHMNETIDQVIGIENIPEDLRVAQLLADFIER
jgi:phenylpropionate dioxygenase-like ring-hydroxylating dioxygenase large terminal subunit